MSDRDPVVVSALRTAIGKAPRGTLRETRPDDLAAACLRATMERTSVPPEAIDDLIVGCAIPEGVQGLNMGRMVGLLAGLPESVPGMTVNRFCSSGIETLAIAADRIRAGRADAILAGGAESMSMVPMGGERFAPNVALAASVPDAYITMGLTGEEVASRYDVSRADQDAFAFRSHQRALTARAAGTPAEEIVPVDVVHRAPGPAGVPIETRATFDTDEGPRADTSPEALAGLRPVFSARGTVTAGNASQMSDGAAISLLTSRAFAASHGLAPLAHLVDYVVVGVAPDVMGIGPAVAIPKLLERNGLGVDDIGVFEINEAFASQALYSARVIGLVDDDERLNPNGGAIAIGHPLGATGARMTATLVHEMQRRGARYGIVSMCVGGGMGAAALFELEGA